MGLLFWSLQALLRRCGRLFTRRLLSGQPLRSVYHTVDYFGRLGLQVGQWVAVALLGSQLRAGAR